MTHQLFLINPGTFEAWNNLQDLIRTNVSRLNKCHEVIEKVQAVELTEFTVGNSIR